MTEMNSIDEHERQMKNLEILNIQKMEFIPNTFNIKTSLSKPLQAKLVSKLKKN